VLTRIEKHGYTGAEGDRPGRLAIVFRQLVEEGHFIGMPARDAVMGFMRAYAQLSA